MTIVGFELTVDCVSKKKLRDTLNAYADILISLSNAYLCLLTADDVARASQKAIEDASARLELACCALTTATSGLNDKPSTYASVASRGCEVRTSRGPTERVSLSSGKSFNIKKCNKIFIGPSQDSATRYPNSSATKDALIKCVDPVAVGIGVSRLRFGPNNTVVIEGDSLDSNRLKDCKSLRDAGLEVRQDAKIWPRVAVHDIPVDFPSDKICSTIISQNLPDASPDDLKVVYLYPAGTKKHRSCIVQLKPELRARIVERKRVCIGWSSCRISDHVRIMQCYKCCGFSNMKDKCENEEVCGKCAAKHPTKECPEGNAAQTLRCINCLNAKSANTNHAATYCDKCPILCRKIQQKISLIDYGDC
uniref:Uncharacterized protein n=1 Tax=Trichogramma kaykai TaxID=54128 RepID=A0ABD2X700_9HYME